MTISVDAAGLRPNNLRSLRPDRGHTALIAPLRLGLGNPLPLGLSYRTDDGQHQPADSRAPCRAAQTSPALSKTFLASGRAMFSSKSPTASPASLLTVTASTDEIQRLLKPRGVG